MPFTVTSTAGGPTGPPPPAKGTRVDPGAPGVGSTRAARTGETKRRASGKWRLEVEGSRVGVGTEVERRGGSGSRDRSRETKDRSGFGRMGIQTK